jgi:DnaJ domain
MPSYYEILGVEPDADEAAIRAAYRTLIRRYHPDTNLDEPQTRAQEINEAYHVLSDAARRAKYDLGLGRRGAAARSPAPPPAPPPPPRQPAAAARRSERPIDAGQAPRTRPTGLLVAAAAALLVVGGLAAGLYEMAGHGHLIPPADPPGAAGTARPARGPAPSPAPARPTLASLDPDETASLETFCLRQEVAGDVAGYDRCRGSQLELLGKTGDRPDLSRLGPGEKTAIEAGCAGEKWGWGPAAYDRCRAAKLALLASTAGSPALASLAPRERSLVASFCLNQAEAQSPETFSRCLTGQVALLNPH